MKHFSRFSLMFLALLLFNAAIGQDEEAPVQKGFDKNKLFFGGNFGLSFGNYTMINVTPQVGYRFNKTFAAGTGLSFQYTSYKTRYENSAYDYKETYGVAGLNIFGRLYPIDFAFLQLQPEFNYVWGNLKFYDGVTPEQTLDSKFVPSILAGAGAGIPAGRGAFIVMAQYDLLQQDRNPYGNRVFFSFGYNTGF
jgi:hypothetical protein